MKHALALLAFCALAAGCMDPGDTETTAKPRTSEEHMADQLNQSGSVIKEKKATEEQDEEESRKTEESPSANAD